MNVFRWDLELRTTLENSLLTCKNDMLSVSLSASIQNWSKAVVCWRRAVQVVTWSFSARTLRSLSWRMQSRSCILRWWIASISASHWADTMDSNSTQLSWNKITSLYLIPFLLNYLYDQVNWSSLLIRKHKKQTVFYFGSASFVKSVATEMGPALKTI